MQTLTFGPLKFHAIYLLHGESTDALQGFTERDGDFKRAVMARQDWAAPLQLRAWAVRAGLTEAEADEIDWTGYSIEGLPVPEKGIGEGTRDVMILGQWEVVRTAMGDGDDRLRPLDVLMLMTKSMEEAFAGREQINGFNVEITSLRQQAAAADEVVMVSTGGKAVPVEDVAAPEALPLEEHPARVAERLLKDSVPRRKR